MDVCRAAREAAVEIRRYLRRKNGGKLPKSFMEWSLLANEFGIMVRPWDACPSLFTAELREGEHKDIWAIVYNPGLSLWRRCRLICHELFEYVAIHNFPSLKLALPDSMSQIDFRHLVAMQGEALCFRITEKQRRKAISRIIVTGKIVYASDLVSNR